MYIQEKQEISQERETDPNKKKNNKKIVIADRMVFLFECFHFSLM